MTIENLSSAIKLNNNYLIAETNKLIDWINGELNEVLLNHVQNIDNIYDLLVQLKTIEKADTNKLTNILNKVNSDTNQRITDLNDASEKHFKDITIHVTQDDKDNWNQKIGTNATDLKKHIEDTVAHTTQAEKDAWTNSIANNKKSLENHISDTVSHVTQDEKDTWTNGIDTNKKNLNDHIKDTVAHVTQTEKDTWTNGIKDNKDNLANHVNNTVIHVTKEDKDLWNATLKNAKDYAKSLFDKVINFDIVVVSELPSTDINTHAIYFLNDRNDPHNLYTEYMYIKEKWEIIGNTKIDLSDYVTKEMLKDLKEAILEAIDNIKNDLNTNYKPYVHSHSNKDILDKLSVDNLNQLLYDGNKVGSSDNSGSGQAVTEDEIKAMIESIMNNGTSPNFYTSDGLIIETSDNKIFMANSDRTYSIIEEYNRQLTDSINEKFKNYYTKSEVYNKTEIDQKFDDLKYTDDEVNKATEESLDTLGRPQEIKQDPIITYTDEDINNAETDIINSLGGTPPIIKQDPVIRYTDQDISDAATDIISQLNS